MSEKEVYVPVNPAERERLTKLLEELLEAGKEITKILSHGYMPTHDGVTFDNRAALQDELGDVLGEIDRMVKAKDINPEIMVERGRKRLANAFTRHQGV